MSWRVIEGDALTVLRTLPDASVHCCVSSPPYWGLRNYHVDGQIGLETTPDEYVAKLVEVFGDVRRVLRADGTLWLNLGDCYATGAGKVGDHPGGGQQGARWRGDVDRLRDDKRGYRGDRLANGRGDQPAVLRNKTVGVGPMTQPNRMPIVGLKAKDLVGIPWRVAFALQANGWWLRSDCIWEKPNPMPESVTDRPTKAHEYVFLMTKAERYHFDADAVREPLSEGSAERYNYAFGGPKAEQLTAEEANGPGSRTHPIGQRSATAGRNVRTVWTIATQPFKDAHFAVMPQKLAERCILAGCPVSGTVLDPFAGASTTGVVARRLGRSFIGIELNPQYAAMGRSRIIDDQPLLNAGTEVGA